MIPNLLYADISEPSNEVIKDQDAINKIKAGYCFVITCYTERTPYSVNDDSLDQVHHLLIMHRLKVYAVMVKTDKLIGFTKGHIKTKRTRLDGFLRPAITKVIRQKGGAV